MLVSASETLAKDKGAEMNESPTFNVQPWLAFLKLLKPEIGGFLGMPSLRFSNVFK